MDRTPTHHARRAALLGASALALVFAAAPERARAQPFAGSHTIAAGDATVTPGANVTTIDVKAARTVINWVPSALPANGAIPFLPENTTAAFISNNLADYTVLNRILPGGTAPVGLYGTITSSASSGGAEPTQVAAGNVWFYTPNGFIIGPRAVISVGGLLLTTNDVLYSLDANGGVSFTDANGAANLRGTADSKAAIAIRQGASIAGNNPNSYIAMVAPRIEQRGSVSADRSIAYVAGEAVDLTIDAGTFGITVLTGTSDAEGIVHTGTTGGTASTGFFDSKTISFVAIPRNEAMTMLLSGSIGYAPAASVFSDGSAIVLAAGNASSPAANIKLGQGEFRNAVTGVATGDLTIAPDAPGPNSEGTSDTVFRSFANFTGEKSVDVIAAGGTRIQADSGLSLTAGNAAAAGTIAIEAYGGGFQNGTIAVSGSLSATADHRGGTSQDGATGLDGQGGEIAVGAYGGTIGAGSLYLSAQGDGGRGNVVGGTGTGGSIDLAAGLGGTISTGFAQLTVNGDGGQGFDFRGEQAVPGRGGVGRGGAITVADSLGDATEDPDGGTLDLGSLSLSASAVGGNSLFGSGLGGDAFGGTIGIVLDRQDAAWFSLSAYARAQDGESALDPVGGDISMTVGGGISVDLAELYLDASATTGVNGPSGAFARGGTIDLSVIEGATLRTQFSLNLVARADTAFFSQSPPDSTADLTGGDITMTADSGTIEAGSIAIDVGAYNYGAAIRAGFAQGGTAVVTATNGGTVATRAQDGEGTPSFEVSAEAYTGAGVAVGEARGGDITLAALTGGTIAAPFINIVLEAAGETGIVQTEQTNGARAVGGTISIDAIGGSITAPIEAYAFGQGGTADLAGGAGTGGSIDVRVLEGGSVTGNLLAHAYGAGGASLSNGDGGDGRGGSFTSTSDALASFTGFSLDFQGYGEGGTAASGRGGDGYGGSTEVDVIGGEHIWSSAIFNVSAGGAASQGSGSLAGSAFGEPAGAQFHVGGGGSLTIEGSLLLDATAFADSNGGANQAIGGAAGVLVDGGASLTAGSIVVGATAYLLDQEFDPNTTTSTPMVRGGTASLIADGGTIAAPLIEVVADGDTAGALTSAGTATGGTAILGAANGGSIALSGQTEFGGLSVRANGQGGEGPSAAHAFGGTATVYTAGGTITSPFELEVRADALAGSYAGFFDEFAIPSSGFDAIGGSASVEMRAGGTGTGAITLPSLTVSAQGLAGSIGAVPGNGGNGTGGTATLAVAEGDLSLDFSLRVRAGGLGGSADENGEGTTPFAGGDGTGGTASFLLSGGSVTAPEIGIESHGGGASGVGFNAGATPSLAGDGTGGSAVFSASGGTLVVTGFSEGGGGLTVDGSGFGGEGAFNPGPGVGGTGGAGTGGNALFAAPAGSTASLTIAGSISVIAEGVGGGAGSSASESFGTGGNATGGGAAMRLADVPFAFGDVLITGAGNGGFGTPAGTGNGGSAEFSLVDSGNAAAARSIDRLTLLAMGTDFTGIAPSGAGGTTVFTAHAGNPGAGLAIDGDLLVDATGATAPAGNGFTGTIAGAPVTVAGTVQLYTPRDAVLTIVAPGALAVTGDLTIDVGRTFTSSGAVSTLANAHVIAPGGISMTDLSAGGTTLLQAVGGPVTVSNNLASGGRVTVLGRSVDLVSLGALGFADADATAGDLAIRTAGDLDLVTVDATGAVTLTSTGGGIHNTGTVNGVGITYIAAGDVRSDSPLASGGALTVDAGGTFTAPGTVAAVGNVSLSADLGLALTGVTSGGTTLLQADAGAVSVANLTSPGAVTALGRSVTIASAGALSFASAQATAGDLQLVTAGNLALAEGGASGAISLTSSGGTISGTGSIVAGGGVAASGATGIALGTLASGGATSLLSSGGAVGVTSLDSAGPVTARGTSVSIGSSGALSFADLDASAGNVDIQTSGNLAVNTVDATGSITLVSTGGSLAASGALNGVGITLGSLDDLTLSNTLATSGAISLTSTNGKVTASSPITAGGSVAVSGNTGITLGTAVSGATTALTSTDGAIVVAGLTSAGAVAATGRSVDIASPGALTFAGLTATAGNARVATTGALGLADASATGTLTLTSSGGAVSSSGTLTVGGAASVTGSTGIALSRLASGGATALSAPNGALSVADLTSAGLVSAGGRSMTIGSSGALAFADLDATAGDLAVTTAGNLAVTTVDATGSVNLTSTGGALAAVGAINGNGIALSSAANLALAQALITPGALSLTSTAGIVTAAGPIGAGGNLAVSGHTGIALGTVTGGGTTSLAAANGSIGVANLSSVGAVTASGRSVGLGSAGALNVANAQASAGNLAITTAQALKMGSASATGTVALTAGGDLATTGSIAGAGIALSGTSLALGGPVQSSAVLDLSARQLLTVSSLATGTAITAAAADIAIGATGRLGSRGLTQTLRITNQSASVPINFGGSGASGQFSLDQAEAARLFADQSITIAGRSSEGGGGDIRIGALAMSYGTASTANIGSGGTLKVDTAGNVTVNGAVTLATSAAADTFSIDPRRIEVIAGSGSIAMLGAGGAPLGSLVLEGGTIVVADQSVIEAIGASVDFTAIRRLLDQPTAARSDSGLLQAGSIDLFAHDALYIQNTGASTATSARRGFTAGAVNIDAGSSSTRIAINGVISGPTGRLTGRQAIDAITINGSHAARGGAFDPMSTINGCVIGSACTSQGIPASSDLTAPVVGSDLGDGGLSGELIQLDDTEPLISPPLVDEPITGVGNDDLWKAPCDTQDDEADCPAGEGENEE